MLQRKLKGLLALLLVGALASAPAIAKNDLVLLHGVHDVRLSAEARVISHPRDNTIEPGYRDRWPWELDLELHAWVDLITDGVPSGEVLPSRAFRRIQVGAPYAQVSVEEFETARQALRSLAGCRVSRLFTE